MTYFNLLELYHAPNYRYVYLPLSSFWSFYRSWSLFLLKDSANFCILFLTLVRLNLALRTVSPGIFVPPVKEEADWFCPDMRQSKIETVIFGVSFVGQCFRLMHFGVCSSQRPSGFKASRMETKMHQSQELFELGHFSISTQALNSRNILCLCHN